MRIASIVSAAALLALATAGSALAAEPFATLDGVSAQTMSSAELDSVQGEGLSGTLTLFGVDRTVEAPAAVGGSGSVIISGGGAAVVDGSFD